MTTGFPDTMYGNATTQARLQSETADSITWARYAITTPLSSAETSHNHGRATFEEIESPTPLHAALQRARLLQQHPHRPVMVIVGRSRHLAVEDHRAELRTLETEHGGAVRADVRKTVGDVGTAFVMAGIDTNLLVMQASGTHAD
jgi:K+:H+ antiporter